MRRSFRSARSGAFGRRGFTLVELLVVITILGMLMVMIFPAVTGAFANANKTKCTASQRDVAQMVNLHVNARQSFPGYSTPVPIQQGASTSAARKMELRSWIVEVSKQTDEATFAGMTGAPGATAPKKLSKFICPVAPSKDDETINYVANCGRQDAKSSSASIPADWKGNGLFMRKYLPGAGGSRAENVTMSDLGTKPVNRTIVISENLQATKWNKHENNEADVGIVWHLEAIPEHRGINKDLDKQLETGDYNYARPSSYHPGGVVLTFVDASSHFLSEDANYQEVYCKLMITNPSQAKEPGQNTPVAQKFRQPFVEDMLNR